MQEFRNNLLFGLQDELNFHPDLCKSIFVWSKESDLTANDLFSLIACEYSVEGSNTNLIEQRVIQNFQDFLYDLEANGEICNIHDPAMALDELKDDSENEIDDDDTMKETCLGVKDILFWITGIRHKPNFAEFKITLKFDHDCMVRLPEHKICFPSVQACIQTITLPVNHMLTAESFRNTIILALCNSQAFALQ